MPIYTMNVEATFAFDVVAKSPEDALARARRLLKAKDPVNDHGAFRNEYVSPWVAVAHADEDFKTLEVVDVWEGDDSAN